MISMWFKRKPSDPKACRTPDEAVAWLLSTQLDLVEHTKQFDGSRDDYLITTHGTFGPGMWLRNNMGLWQTPDKVPLVRWFHKHGLSHADDMSPVILGMFFESVRGGLYTASDLDKHVSACQAHWAKFPS